MANVLVVDDEADILELIKVNLELDGHRVVTALGGEEALDRLRESHPDLILLDVMMPGVDGWTVLGRIKSETDVDISRIPVLMVTARTAQEDRIRGGIEGAIRYVTKPFSPSDLRDEVRDALVGEPEPVKRRKVQQESLEQLARLEKGTAVPTTAQAPAPRPKLTKFEHAREARVESLEVREARQKAAALSPKQKELLQVLRESRSVSEAAARLGVSRSNVYASLRRIGRKLGTRSVPELLALVRAGDLTVDSSSAGQG
jgi:DNA-binding response OmpR family regulator